MSSYTGEKWVCVVSDMIADFSDYLYPVWLKVYNPNSQNNKNYRNIYDLYKNKPQRSYRYLSFIDGHYLEQYSINNIYTYEILYVHIIYTPKEISTHTYNYREIKTIFQPLNDAFTKLFIQSKSHPTIINQIMQNNPDLNIEDIMNDDMNLDDYIPLILPLVFQQLRLLKKCV